MSDADPLMHFCKWRTVTLFKTIDLETSGKLHCPFPVLLRDAFDQVGSDLSPAVYFIEDPFKNETYSQHSRQAEAINVYIFIVSRRLCP